MTKWHSIMSYIHLEGRGGPVLGPSLEAMAVSRFESTPSTVTARLRELRDCGFLTQDTGRIGAKKKRYVAYTCSADQWWHWTHGGPEALKAYLREKRKHLTTETRRHGESTEDGGRRGTADVSCRAPDSSQCASVSPCLRAESRAGEQLTLGDAAEPKRHWKR